MAPATRFGGCSKLGLLSLFKMQFQLVVPFSEESIRSKSGSSWQSFAVGGIRATVGYEAIALPPVAC